jgi:apolipoprotein N-acyltransferase
VMRGVEDGFTIARAARQGYLTVSDDRGRILAESRSDAAPFSTLVADLPVAHGATLYRRFGDWFAWLMLAVAATSVLSGARRDSAIESSP